MSRGICSGCKKHKELNAHGYCNTSGCSAQSLGADIASKLIDMVESLATQYVSKTTFKIIFGSAVALAFFIYLATKG